MSFDSIVSLSRAVVHYHDGLEQAQAKVEALEARLAEAQATERALVISMHLVDPRSSCGWFDDATSDALGLPELSMLDQMVSETRVEDFDPVVIAAMRRVIARRKAIAGCAAPSAVARRRSTLDQGLTRERPHHVHVRSTAMPTRTPLYP